MVSIPLRCRFAKYASIISALGLVWLASSHLRSRAATLIDSSRGGQLVLENQSRPVKEPTTIAGSEQPQELDNYACSILVNIHRLRRLQDRRVSDAYISTLTANCVTIHVQDIPPLASGIAYYRYCLLKLLAFKMHILSPGLRRVLAFDSDQLIMKNLDHLLHRLPEIDLAAPRAYWISTDCLSSTFLIINLSDRLWKKFAAALVGLAPETYDMDLVNQLFRETVTMLDGEYITINSHWEDWILPAWYHPTSDSINTTLLNLLSSRSPQDQYDEEEVTLARHKMDIELYGLQEAAAIIHFFAVGKPWMYYPHQITATKCQPSARPAIRCLA